MLGIAFLGWPFWREHAQDAAKLKSVPERRPEAHDSAPGAPRGVLPSACASSSRLALRKPHAQAPSVELSAHAFWPNNTNVRRPYSAHYLFADHFALINSWLLQYAAWHDGPKVFLDVGGRGGEVNGQLAAVAAYDYMLLERDAGRAARKYKSVVCDLFDCQVALCSADIVYNHCETAVWACKRRLATLVSATASSASPRVSLRPHACVALTAHADVLEHLVSPEKAMRAMASFVKTGGLLITVLPWTGRYHAEDTYGHYTQLSARALEYMCIENGLNPVRSGYDSVAQRGGDKDGVRPYNVIDRTPYVWPGTSEFNSYAICYKPRPGERAIRFEEAGELPAEMHPHFELRFDELLSEHATRSDRLLVTRARLLPLAAIASIRSPSSCSGLRPGELVVVLDEQQQPRAGISSSIRGHTGIHSQEAVRRVRFEVIAESPGDAAYRGAKSRVVLSDGRSYRVRTYGRC